MTKFAFLILTACLPATLLAQGKADPRAIADCNAQFSAFAKIAECLPEADVGVRMLDFFVTEPPPTKVSGFSVFGAPSAQRRIIFRLKSEASNQFVESEDGLGPETQPVVEACLEKNENQLQDTWSCVNGAYQSALELGAMLPDGSNVSDPLFAPLNQPEKKARVDAEQKAARGRFPHVSMWGMNMYRALK